MQRTVFGIAARQLYARTLTPHFQGVKIFTSSVATTSCSTPLTVIRCFTVSRRSAFPAAVAKKVSPTSTAAKKSPTTAKSKTGAKSTGAKSSKAKAVAKPKAKLKAKPKAKATKPKTAAKKPKKVVKKLTPEERRNAEKRALRKTALLPEPSKLPDSKWLVFYTAALRNIHKPGQHVTAVLKEITAEYRKLSQNQIEELEDTARRNHAENKAAHEKWIKQHTVSQIYAANVARRRLFRVFGAKSPKQIHDDRMMPPAPNGYLLFVKSKWASGDVNPQDSMASIGQQLGVEWKKLTDAQKKPFIDMAQTGQVKRREFMAGLDRP